MRPYVTEITVINYSFFKVLQLKAYLSDLAEQRSISEFRNAQARKKCLVMQHYFPPSVYERLLVNSQKLCMPIINHSYLIDLNINIFSMKKT